jgi:hypothetical protein
MSATILVVRALYLVASIYWIATKTLRVMHPDAGERLRKSA